MRLNTILLHEHVTIDLPPSDASLASKKLHWAMQKVTKLAVEPGLRFKVGITANPPLRWEFYNAEDCTWTDVGVTNYAKYRLESAPAAHSNVSSDQVRQLIRLSGRVKPCFVFCLLSLLFILSEMVESGRPRPKPTCEMTPNG